MRTTLVAASAALVLAMIQPAIARHGWGSYDASKVLVFESKILEMN